MGAIVSNSNSKVYTSTEYVANCPYVDEEVLFEEKTKFEKTFILKDSSFFSEMDQE